MKRIKSLSRSAFEMAGPQRSGAWAVMFNGEAAGKIVWAFPKDGAGSVYCTLSIYSGPLASLAKATGSAGGYGYCKRSGAFSDALERACKAEKPSYYNETKEQASERLAIWDAAPDLHGSGEGAVQSFLESHGYTVISVL
jgi:hypothetical protein